MIPAMRMPPLRVARVAHAVTATSVAASVAGVALAVRGPVGLVLWVTVAVSALYPPVVLVGSALVRAHPGNPVGWLFLVNGAAVPISTALFAAASVTAARGGPDPAWLVVVGNQFLLAYYPLVTFGLLLFPDGHLRARRSRLLAAGTAIWFAGLWTWTVFTKTDFTALPGVRNPIGVGGAVEAGVGTILLAGPVIGLCSWSVWRRASGGTSSFRRGLRLVAGTGWAVAAAFAGCVVVGSAGGSTYAVSIIEQLAVLAVGLGAWAAITRFALYDVRAVVSRSLTYVLLLGVLGGAYTGAVLVIQLVLDPVTDQSGIAVAGSTLLVASLFRPVRARVQSAVDRRFHRSRYDARRTVDSFAARARAGVQLAALTADLTGVVAETLDPSWASVWMVSRRPDPRPGSSPAGRR
jgi:hypothetical protein